jgi:hypothetical protein
MSAEIKTVFPKEAAVLELEKILSNKGKGDRITAKEVLDGTGMSVENLRGRIKTWARRKGFVVQAVPNDGYRILSDVEHVDYTLCQSKSAARKEREGLRSLLSTDSARLDAVQTRRHEFLTPRVAARVARAEQDIKEAKQEFKLTERVPLRALASKS